MVYYYAYWYIDTCVCAVVFVCEREREKALVYLFTFSVIIFKNSVCWFYWELKMLLLYMCVSYTCLQSRRSHQVLFHAILAYTDCRYDWTKLKINIVNYSINLSFSYRKYLTFCNFGIRNRNVFFNFYILNLFISIITKSFITWHWVYFYRCREHNV